MLAQYYEASIARCEGSTGYIRTTLGYTFYTPLPPVLVVLREA